MATKYRLKTAKEFQNDGQFNFRCNVPGNWDEDGEMNNYMGQDIPDKYINQIESGETIQMDGWYFFQEDIVENTFAHLKSGSTEKHVENTSFYLLIKRLKR